MEKDARSLSQDAQEAIRIRAVGMVNSGEKPGKVANFMKVSRRALEKWRNIYREHGVEGLKKKKRGRKKGVGRKLKNFQCATIVNRACPN